MILVNKKRGDTPLYAITRLKQLDPELADKKISYAGRLDPMAQGLLVLLVNEENKERESYLSKTKEYVVSILFGISTDTYDALGRITSTSPITPDLQALKDALSSCKGEFLQKYPSYSSKAINGKPMYYWERRGLLKNLTIPTRAVTINSLEYISHEMIDRKSLAFSVADEIKRIDGDFRQDLIIKDWGELASKASTETLLVNIKAQVSSGTYMRSLANKIGEKLAIPAMAYSIIRTRVGEYTLDDTSVKQYE